MARNSLQSVHHSLPKRQYLSDTPPIFSSSLSLKPNTSTTSLSHYSLSTTTTTNFSLSSTTSSISPSTSETISFDTLQHHLSTQNFRQADEETRRLLIVLAGEAAQKRGYVFFSEVQFISESDLKAIDELWKHHSNNRFGYSVQKKIFEKVGKDFTRFFLKVGWMKKLETEVEQYNYRSFPNEFVWELSDHSPEGHLPLTNALRGTQLLNNILNHPAFMTEEEEEEEEDKGATEDKVGKDEGTDTNIGLKGLKDSSKPMSKTVFKPDYSF
ncbi:tetrapyrrole-binding protein, chloroplastic [Ziziphus jujuba]|uniref:Tetrapyrrole-binding protein, chloroplastic n=2 Tax=Ziziphus jujuba TaxID=326968 RepID=A0A6P3Z6T2_ZIZJJ|nr:tetrapyrrole-binding protein, chloroplastic [Ziziphus jujuba]KAH7514154.1 hypothetical protein FEM48_Zijuj11G0058600 [Ziziphus jujuba var. spinosa]